MPFPLAHPAAVLPFRRYCPRFLSFPALVAGSLAPDVGYFFDGTGLDDFSHSLLGSIGFCLPVGLFMFGCFYALSLVAANHLPTSFHQAGRPAYQRRDSWAAAVFISVLIGIWTHLLLDSITHTHGWAVEHMQLLQSTITHVNGHKVRVCHLLWYVCSFLGVAWLYLAFRDWQASQTSLGTGSWKYRVLEAGLVATLVLPIELAHHMVHGILGLVLVATLSLALVTGIIIRSHSRRQKAACANSPPP